MNDIEKAELTIRNLENIRKHLLQQQAELENERGRVALGAHTGDKKARQRLDEINSKAIAFASEFASVEAAINEATKNLDAARKAEALAADKAAALQLREAIVEFVEECNELDASLEDMAFHANAAKDKLDRIHQLGALAPTSEQFRVNGANCFKSALMKTGWKKEFEFEHIPAHRLQSFRILVSGWASMLMKDVERRLGEPAAREAPADQKKVA
jgi:hypothetical protein